VNRNRNAVLQTKLGREPIRHEESKNQRGVPPKSSVGLVGRRKAGAKGDGDKKGRFRIQLKEERKIPSSNAREIARVKTRQKGSIREGTTNVGELTPAVELQESPEGPPGAVIHRRTDRGEKEQRNGL